MPHAPRLARSLVALSALAAAAPLAPLAVVGAQAVVVPAAYTPHGAAIAAPAVPLRGVFRISMQKQNAAAVPATLIVERRGERLDASLVVDHHVSVLESVRVDGDVLEATVRTEAGPSKLRVRISGDSVDGTLTARRDVWKVLGDRSA